MSSDDSSNKGKRKKSGKIGKVFPLNSLDINGGPGFKKLDGVSGDDENKNEEASQSTDLNTQIGNDAFDRFKDLNRSKRRGTEGTSGNDSDLSTLFNLLFKFKIIYMGGGGGL